MFALSQEEVIQSITKTQGPGGVKIQHRDTVVSWLLEVAPHLEIHPETVGKGARYLDKYLARHRIPLTRLQELGCAALLVACKQRESDFCTPSLSWLENASCGAFTAQSLKKTEVSLCEALEWFI